MVPLRLPWLLMALPQGGVPSAWAAGRDADPALAD